MEKKWWRSRGAQTRLLVLLLWVISPTFAGPSSAGMVTKKEKGTVAKTRKSSSIKKATSTIRTSRKRDSRVGSRKSKRTAARTRGAVTSRTRKKKQAGGVKSSVKASRYARSKKSRKSTVKTKGQSRKNTRAERRTLIMDAPILSSAQRASIARNYGGLGVSTSYDPEISSFPIEVNRERFIHRVNSVFVLPGEEITLRAGEGEEDNKYVLQTTSTVVQVGPNTWSWKAPRKVGIYPVSIQQSHWGVAMRLNVFVMAPFSLAKRGNLNGYRIGNYPTIAYRQLSTYTLPRGFIEVTEENEDTQVSPHFRLRQFLCKQEGGYPKYITLDPRLLIVLEAVLQKVNEQGHYCPTLSIMSGYRTPYYNRAIGNSTTYSRHLWGDAADIFVDANPLDGEMDDLNHDGVVNIRDTKVLYDIVSAMYEPRIKRFLTSSFFNEPMLQQLITNGYTDDARMQKLLTGGLARYQATDSHGPFVHVDVRGVFTQWGR